MAPTPPATLADFKTRFNRDFKYGDGLDQVQDNDIQNAMSDAVPLFNPSLFSTADGKTAFLFAAAHFLVTNVQTAGGLETKTTGQGFNNAPEEILSSKSVGGVNMGIVEPPDIIKRSPALYQFWTTGYGRRYIGMLVPRLVGPFGAVMGRAEADTGAGITPSVPFAEFT